MRSPSVWKSFGYAFEGIGHALRTQRNARIHAVMIGLVSIAGLCTKPALGPVEWAVLALTMGLVCAAELLNTSLEAIVDRLEPEPHPLAKIAKDTAAGSVLVLAMTAVVVGVCVLGPGLLTRVWGLLVTRGP